MSNKNQTILQVSGGFLGKDIAEYSLVALTALLSHIIVQVFFVQALGLGGPSDPVMDGLSPALQGDARLPSTEAAESFTGTRLLVASALSQLAVFVILLITLRFVIVQLKTAEWFRLAVDPRARFEGRWLEIFYDDEVLDSQGGYLKFRPVNYGKFGEPISLDGSIGARYAVFDISYNEDNGQYSMTGVSYYPNSLYYAYWRSRALIFYPEDNRIDYLFSSDGNGDSSIVRGAGSLNFRRKEFRVSKKSKGAKREVRKENRRKYHSGIGSFSENRSSANRYSVEFIRITDEEIDCLVPDRAKMHPAAVLRKFVMEYHRLLGDKLAGGLLDPIHPETKCKDEASPE